MNILHVYKDYLPESYGGLEQTIFQICRATTQLGFDNRVFTLSKSGTKGLIYRPEATVCRHTCSLEVASCGVSLPAVHTYPSYVRWADVIHYHFPWPFADFLHCLHRVKKPCLVTYHSDIVRQKKLDLIYAPLKKRFLASIDRIIATSENYVRTSRVLKKYEDKVEVIPFGIAPETYPAPEPDRVNSWRKKLGDNFFLFVGVLRYYKGLHILLQAMVDAPYQAVIVGAGPIEGELRARAEKLGLQNMHFLGFQPDADKMALYSLSKGVVFPSNQRSEAFGITLLEALMAGRPMISSEIGTGTSFINAHQETGLVVKPNDPHALRQAMDTLFRHPALAEHMGRRARKRFELSFTADLMGKSYSEHYVQIHNKK